MAAVKRSDTRKKSLLHANLRVSLIQTLTAEDTLVKFDATIDSTKNKNLRYKLQALSRLLVELLLPAAGESKPCGWLDYEYAYELFSSFFLVSPERIWFRDALLDNDYGIPVALFRRPTGARMLVLNDPTASIPNILLHIAQQDEAHCAETEQEENISVDLVHRALDSMVNEYDRSVATMLLCAGKSRSEQYQLGMNPDRAKKRLAGLEDRLLAWENAKSAAKDLVQQRLTERCDRLQDRIDEATAQIGRVAGKWVPERVGDLESTRDYLLKSLDYVKKLKAADTPFYQQRRRNAVKRKANELADQQRIKKRALGSGAKPMMDEEDEIWLAKCIEDKTTVHGRRHETVLYTHHRVKSRDLLKLANYKRQIRGLPLIRALSTVTSKARPRRLKSIQSRRHKGLGLWCSKKPPKTEDRDNECTHHQRKHVALAKEHLFGRGAGEGRCHALAISMDDKAYLRPGTSEGFAGARKQSILQPTDDSAARKLPTHDFPEPSMYITPSAFRLLRKEPAGVDGSNALISTEDSSIAVIHPKAYVGTDGTTWASNYMRLRRECPDEFETNTAETTTHCKELRKLCSWAKDAMKYFIDTAMKEDVVCVTQKPDCPFRDYIVLQLRSLKRQLKQATKHWLNVKEGLPGEERAIGAEVLDKMASVVEEQEVVETGWSSLHGKRLWERFVPLIKACQELLAHLDGIQLPHVCPQILELTDAGPGVGVSNFEVRFRAAERVRIHSTDLLCRIHRAREDSGQNEAERLNASIGDAICDGGAIRWQIYSETHGLSELDKETMTRASLEEHAHKMMEENAWAVAEEVRQRIEQSPAPSGYITTFTVEKPECHFFYNQAYLREYMKTPKTQRSSVPGHNYFEKINAFIETHFEFGELYMEYLKGSCKDSGANVSCNFCTNNPFSGPPHVTRVPRPYPDHQRLPDLKYLPYDRTPVDGRQPDDYQPRAQLKAEVGKGTVRLDNPLSITEFSEKYVVSEDKVRDYVQHIEQIQLMKRKRVSLTEERRAHTDGKSYDDYDWQDLYRKGLLSTLRVAELDKYLGKHGLNQTGRKKNKLAIVEAHIGKDVCTSILNAIDIPDPHSSSESESEADSEHESESEDEVLLEANSESSDDKGGDDEGDQECVSRFGRKRQRVQNPDFVFY